MDVVANNKDLELQYFNDNDEIINDFIHCSESKALKSLLNIEMCFSTFNKCFDFKDTQNIPDGEHFYALSAYYWNFWKFLNITETSINFIETQQRIQQVCNYPQAENGPTDCFELTYIFNLLNRAYKIQVRICTYLSSI